MLRLMESRPLARWARLLGCGLLLLLTGCAADQYRRLPDPTPITYDRISIRQLMEELDERRNGIEDAAVRLNLVLRDNAKNKEHGLSGIYLGDKAGNMRLRMTYSEHLVLDLAIHGETVDLWLPRKGRYYRGTRKDLLAAPDCELSLFAYVGQVHELFFPRAWTEQAVERRVRMEGVREVISVLERPGLRRRCVRRVVISPEQPVVEEMAIYNRNDKSLGMIQYADYRFPGPLAGARDKSSIGVPWPGRVVLFTADKNRSLQMDVEELTINRSIPLAKYEIEVPCEESTEPRSDHEGSGTKAGLGKSLPILNLGDALQGGKSLWE